MVAPKSISQFGIHSIPRWVVSPLLSVCILTACSDAFAPGHGSWTGSPQFAAASSGAVKVAVGTASTCVLRASGNVECEGVRNIDFQPLAPVSGAPGGYIDIAMGGDYLCALRNDGAVECSGVSSHGAAPATKTAEAGTLTKISAMGETTCGLRTDGDIECWGQAPALVTPSGSSFVEIAAGVDHGCALRADHAVQCWGNNAFGKAPALMSAPPYDGTQITGIAVGHQFSCVLTSDATIQCFGIIEGWNYLGVYAREGGFSTVSTSPGGMCGLGNDGVADCIKFNPPDFDTGEPDRTRIETRSSVGRLARLAAGDFHFCAARQTGGIECWGDDAHGQLVNDEVPPVPSFETNALESAFALTWTDASTLELRFEIQRRVHNADGSFTPFALVTNAAANSTAYDDALVTSGVSYQYRVRACAPVECSRWRNGSIVRLSQLPLAPSAIQSVMVGDAASVTWADASTNETGFVITRRAYDNAWSAWQIVGATSAGEAIFLDSGLTEGVKHQYRVQACGPGGCSANVTSNTVAFMLPATDFVAANGISPAVMLTWTTASTARDRFEISVRHRVPGNPWSAWQVLPNAGAEMDSMVESTTPAEARRIYRIRTCRASVCSAWTLSNLLLPS